MKAEDEARPPGKKPWHKPTLTRLPCPPAGFTPQDATDATLPDLRNPQPADEE